MTPLEKLAQAIARSLHQQLNVCLPSGTEYAHYESDDFASRRKHGVAPGDLLNAANQLAMALPKLLPPEMAVDTLGRWMADNDVEALHLSHYCGLRISSVQVSAREGANRSWVIDDAQSTDGLNRAFLGALDVRRARLAAKWHRATHDHAPAPAAVARLDGQTSGQSPAPQRADERSA